MSEFWVLLGSGDAFGHYLVCELFGRCVWFLALLRLSFCPAISAQHWGRKKTSPNRYPFGQKPLSKPRLGMASPPYCDLLEGLNTRLQ